MILPIPELENVRQINQIMKYSERPSLFNEYGAMNQQGNDLYSKFDHIVSDFLKENCLDLKLFEVEYILNTVISGNISEKKLHQALILKKLCSKT